MARGVVGVGQRADRLLRQLAAARARRAGGCARARCRPRTAARSGAPTATDAPGRARHGSIPRQSASLDLERQQADRRARLGRVAAQVARPRSRRGPWWRRSTGARAARPRARAGRGRAARPRAGRARAGARRRRSVDRDLADQARGRRRVGAERRRAERDDVGRVGQRDLDAVAGRAQRVRVDARVAERAPPRACSAASAPPSESDHPSPLEPARSSSSNASSVSSLAISSRLARSQRSRGRASTSAAVTPRAADVSRTRAAHARRSRRRRPKDWNTLRSRTA